MVPPGHAVPCGSGRRYPGPRLSAQDPFPYPGLSQGFPPEIVRSYFAVSFRPGNKLDRRSPFIETEEREDIFAAFEQILDEANISERREEIIQAMDDKRDW